MLNIFQSLFKSNLVTEERVNKGVTVYKILSVFTFLILAMIW